VNNIFGKIVMIHKKAPELIYSKLASIIGKPLPYEKVIEVPTQCVKDIKTSLGAAS